MKKNIVFRCLSLGVLITVLFFGGIQAFALTFTENSNATFNGTKANTQWTGGATSAIQLTPAGRAARTGTYTSVVKNFGSNASWNSIAWTPREPYTKEIPNNGASETVYAANNLTNTNNLLNLHYNETIGTTFTDNSGNANNGTCPGTISPAPPSVPTCPTLGNDGVFNKAPAFTSTSPGNSINISPTATNTITNRFTVSSWAKLNTFPANDHAPIVWKGNQLFGAEYAFRIATFGTNSFTFGSTVGGVQYFTNGVGTFNTGQWYHLALVYDGVNVLGYVNGVQVSANGVAPANGNVDLFPTKNVISGWGWRSDQTSDISLFDGQIDEIGVWNRAFTVAQIITLYRRGVLRIKHQVRSCGTITCAGVNFTGPGGLTTTFYTDPVIGNNILPAVALSGVNSAQFFQYQSTLETDDTALTPNLRVVTVDYTLITTPSLAIVIRNSSDTGNVNSCDLGTATSAALATCSYRIKVTSNSSSGYIIFVTTSGGLTESSVAMADAGVGTGGAGGNLINGATTGTERYGVFIVSGSITGTGGITRNTAYNAGATNSTRYNTVAAQPILTSLGTNSPGAIDLVNTSLITHNLNISDGTVAGSYTQTITYTVTASF